MNPIITMVPNVNNKVHLPHLLEILGVLMDPIDTMVPHVALTWRTQLF